jgi:hypothetical protein
MERQHKHTTMKKKKTLNEPKANAVDICRQQGSTQPNDGYDQAEATINKHRNG